MEFLLQPAIYKTGNHSTLRGLLEEMWTREGTLGQGHLYFYSGFANFNGGARFYRSFREHTERGGQITAVLGGSVSQNMSSRQVVEALLQCGVDVRVVNRKAILHAKLYGRQAGDAQDLVVTSGNFTGPGMSRNVEACVRLNSAELHDAGFSWQRLVESCEAADWLVYRPSIKDRQGPGWRLLFDETPGRRRRVPQEQDFDAATMVLILGHADTARIQAAPGTTAGLGSQYFWLSKDAFDFFPPLTITNQRGIKGTLSAIVEIRYPDLDMVDPHCRVTFEAENNLDFRLGTGLLRYTRTAATGDLACISRIGETIYEIRLIRRSQRKYRVLQGYATDFIGHQGKRYGFLENEIFARLAGVQLGTIDV